MPFDDLYLRLELEDLDKNIGGMVTIPEWKFKMLLELPEAETMSEMIVTFVIAVLLTPLILNWLRSRP